MKLAAIASLFTMLAAQDVNAQSGALVTSGMGGGASSTARLQAQVNQMQQRLAAIEDCGADGQMFGGSGYTGAKDGQCIRLLLMNEGNDYGYIRTRLKVGGDLSAPAYPLDVVGSGRFDGHLLLEGGNRRLTTPNGFLDIRPGSGTHGIVMRDHTGGGTSWTGIRTATGPTRMEFAGGSSGHYGSSLIISDDGNVGIGITPPSTKKFYVEGDSRFDGHLVIEDQGGNTYTLRDDSEPVGIALRPDSNPASGAPLFLVKSAYGGDRLRVEHDGVVSSMQDFQAPGFFYSSDSRLKNKIERLDAEEALAKLSKLDAVSYQWKERQLPDGVHLGLIAQDVEKVYPELVRDNIRREGGENYKSVSYGQVVAPLIEAVKALKARNEELARRVEALEQK